MVVYTWLSCQRKVPFPSSIVNSYSTTCPAGKSNDMVHKESVPSYRSYSVGANTGFQFPNAVVLPTTLTWLPGTVSAMLLKVTRTGLVVQPGFQTVVNVGAVVEATSVGVVRKGSGWRDGVEVWSLVMVGVEVLEVTEEMEEEEEEKEENEVLGRTSDDVVGSGMVEVAEFEDCCSADTDEEDVCTDVLERLAGVGSRRL